MEEEKGNRDGRSISTTYTTMKTYRKKRNEKKREREMEDISGEKVRTGLRKMKKGKAQGPDDIPVEA